MVKLTMVAEFDEGNYKLYLEMRWDVGGQRRAEKEQNSRAGEDEEKGW